jgi:hypothetical protein
MILKKVYIVCVFNAERQKLGALIYSVFLCLAESEEEEDTDPQQGGTKKRKAKKGTS